MCNLVDRIITDVTPKKIGGANIDVRVFFQEMAELTGLLEHTDIVLPRFQDQLHRSQAAECRNRAFLVYCDSWISRPILTEISSSSTSETIQEEKELHQRFGAYSVAALASYDTDTASHTLQPFEVAVERCQLENEMRRDYMTRVDAYRVKLSAHAEQALKRMHDQEKTLVDIGNTTAANLDAVRQLGPRIAALTLHIEDAKRALAEQDKKQERARQERQDQYAMYERERRKKKEDCIIC